MTNPIFKELFENFKKTRDLQELIRGCRNLTKYLFNLKKPYVVPSDFPVFFGGNYLPEELIAAYSLGLFPWGENPSICWFFPKKRAIFPLEKSLHIGRSLKKIIKKDNYEVKADTAFLEVITLCQKLRQNETWITNRLIKGYYQLYQLGFAHSVEVYQNNELVAGVYGVNLGRAFFAESMFYLKSNMSKVALVYLHTFFKNQNGLLFDIQTFEKDSYKEYLGAKLITPKKYRELLETSFTEVGLYGSWQNKFTFPKEWILN